jgi:hypothetical protein
MTAFFIFSPFFFHFNISESGCFFLHFILICPDYFAEYF